MNRHLAWIPLALGLGAGLAPTGTARAADLVPDAGYGRDGVVLHPDDSLSGSSYGYVPLPAPSLVLADGGALFAGTAGDGSVRVLKVDPEGRPAAGFGSNGRVILPLVSALGGSTPGLAATADGKILVAGARPTSAVRVLRLLDSGALDLRFGNAGFADLELPGGEGPPRAIRIALDRQQRVRVVASCDPVGIRAARTCPARSWRLLADGSLDASFAPTAIIGSAFGTSYPLSIAIMDDDSSFVLLEEPENDMDNLERVVRFLPDGRLDEAGAAPIPKGQILAMHGTGTRLYLSQSVYARDGTRSGILARFLDSGAADLDFGVSATLGLVEPTSLGSSAAYVVALASDGAQGLLASGALLASTNNTWGTLFARIDTTSAARADPEFGRSGYARLPLPFTFYLGQSLRRVGTGRIIVAGYSVQPQGRLAPTVARLVEVDSGNDARSGWLMFAGGDLSVAEDAGTARVRVLRSGGARGAASATYATRAGTARDGDDFLPREGRLDWADGDATDRLIEIPIVADRNSEANERFTVVLSDASGATFSPQTEFTVTIEERAVAAPATAPSPDASGSGGSGGGGALDDRLVLLLASLVVARLLLRDHRQCG